MISVWRVVFYFYFWLWLWRLSCKTPHKHPAAMWVTQTSPESSSSCGHVQGAKPQNTFVHVRDTRELHHTPRKCEHHKLSLLMYERARRAFSFGGENRSPFFGHSKSSRNKNPFCETTRTCPPKCMRFEVEAEFVADGGRNRIPRMVLHVQHT